MEAKFNSSLLESLDFTEVVAPVIEKEKKMQSKIKECHANLERLKLEASGIDEELIKVDGLYLADKMTADENFNRVKKLELKKSELDAQIRAQDRSLKSALEALEIVQQDLQKARESVIAKCVAELDEYMTKHKTNISKLVDELLNELSEAREVFLKRSKFTGDYLGSNTLVHFHNSRLPEIMRIVEALKSVGESEIISKLLHTRV